jgi:hypothetical protein
MLRTIHPPIRLIVATAPGGLMDVAAHTLVDYFQKAYGSACSSRTAAARAACSRRCHREGAA